MKRASRRSLPTGRTTRDERIVLSGYVGWNFVFKQLAPFATLCITRDYLELKQQFHEPILFSPSEVYVEFLVVFPVFWKIVKIYQRNKKHANPLVFHHASRLFRFEWHLRTNPFEEILTQWGYRIPLHVQPQNTAKNPLEHSPYLAKVGQIVTALTPYGKIAVDGKVFPAMSLSGTLQSGEVVVQRISPERLLVTRRGNHQPEASCIGKCGHIVTPLTPYGEIEIDGKVFSSLSCSGNLESGEVIVQKSGGIILFVKRMAE